MNTVRSCIASVLLIVFGSRATSAAAATECCTSVSGDGGGGNHNTCKIGNQTFQAIEMIGGGPCVNNVTALAVRKCCPSNQTYDAESRICSAAVAATGRDDETVVAAAFRRLVLADRPLPPSTVVGYNFESPKCANGYLLIDVQAEDVRQLLHNATAADQHSLPEDYCFDLTSPASPELVARTCRPRDQYCHGDYTCANKCCKGDKMIVDFVCRLRDIPPFVVPVYDTADNGTLVLSNNTPLPYYDKLKCGHRDRLDGDGFKLMADGSIVLTGSGARVPANGYCLEYNTTAADLRKYALAAYVCAPELSPKVMDTKGSWKYLVILVGFIPSIVCLVFTLVVYAMLSSLRNVHGYYVMCYVACLLLSFVCLLVIQWMPDMDTSLCKLFGYMTLFAFLTTFCWLNVICFDIFWILRYNTSINKNTSISIRSILYNIYCWGFSSIYITTAFFFQHSNEPTLQKLAPNIGINGCWFFDTNYGTVIFFLLPVSVMLMANLILFVLTAVHCSRIKSELNKFKRNNSKTQRFQVDKEKFVMSIKLFLVMGIPWSFEILSRIFQNDWFIWHILDEINALQGVMIFIIFVAKRKVIANLRKKFNGSLDHSESTKINTVSGSSQSGSAHKNNYDF